MGLLCEEDGNLEAAGEYGESCDVVEVFVGDEDRVERLGIFTGLRHATHQLFAGQSSVDEDTR
jgi:hypothetical protein